MTAAVVDFRQVPVYDRDEHDFYVDPPWCTELLLDHENFEGTVWDPACGSGTIPEALRRRGILYDGSDLVDRGYGRSGVDFLAPVMPVPSCDNIVTNPPYGKGVLAEAFIRRALIVARRKVAVLVNEKFLYSERRHPLFTGTCLARIYHLSSRPSMPPGELLRAGEVEATGGSVNYAWLVFLRGHQGPPTTHWMIRRKA